MSDDTSYQPSEKNPDVEPEQDGTAPAGTTDADEKDAQTAAAGATAADAESAADDPEAIDG